MVDAAPARLPVTVVIPSLGHECLIDTVRWLNSTGPIPAEILICVPKDVSVDANLAAMENVRINWVPFRGQVRQRAEGFRIATNELVLQLDDDLRLSGDDLHQLVVELEDLGPGNAIAPVLMDRSTGDALCRLPSGLRGTVESIIATLLRGARWGASRLGTVSRFGHNYGVDPGAMSAERVAVDWLPGGCILHFRAGLVTDDYFPLQGKAYAEDLIHSWLLTEADVRLWVTRKARCGVTVERGSHHREPLMRQMRAVNYAARVRGLWLATRTVLIAGYVVNAILSRALWALRPRSSRP